MNADPLNHRGGDPMPSIDETILTIEDLATDWRTKQTIINCGPTLDLAHIEKARLISAERTLDAILIELRKVALP
jgi:hypothetical protein